MSKQLHTAALLAGALTIAWIGSGYLQGHPLALAMTALIASAYAMGVLELRQFRQATATLADALTGLSEPPGQLNDWLTRLHPSLQNAVRLRIEGARTALPGPTLTPYLVGLLVMLGMLGTFLGMVVTLNGAVFALEGTTDLQAMRTSLATPIKGLGLAFGTSVAGVAASAMLGLMSALSRRERLQATHGLDSRIATSLRRFSLAWQRQESLHDLQQHAQALPALVTHLPALVTHMQTMMTQMAQQNLQLHERLLASQEHFHRDTRDVYTELARSVDQSLKDSLGDSARIAGQSLQPVVEAAMAGIAHEASLLQQNTATNVQNQLDGFSAGFSATQTALTESWTHALDTTLTTLRQERQLAQSQALSEQQALCATLAQTAQDIGNQTQAQASKTIAEVARLMDAATAAPRAAADVITQLRQEVSSGIARDNALLDERNRLMSTLDTLLDAITHAAAEQRGAIDALVGSSAELLDRVGTQFVERVSVESTRMSDTAVQLGSSAIEVASLGEAFGAAVQHYAGANETLVASLQRIDAALDRSMTRSDEQLAYYVAQAREVIDLSLMAQKKAVDELNHYAKKPAGKVANGPQALADEVC